MIEERIDSVRVQEEKKQLAETFLKVRRDRKWYLHPLGRVRLGHRHNVHNPYKKADSGLEEEDGEEACSLAPVP